MAKRQLKTRIQGVGLNEKQVSVKKLAKKQRQAEAVVAPVIPKGLVPYSPEKISAGRPVGQTFLSRVREILKTTSVHPDPMHPERMRFDDAAEAFVRQMEAGNFQFHKEFIDREEGKVTQKIDFGVTTKLYVGMPTEGEDAP
jgi:hypothetical protein